MEFRAMLVLPGLAWLGGLLAALVRPPYFLILRGDEAGVENIGEIKLINIAYNQIPDSIC